MKRLLLLLLCSLFISVCYPQNTPTLTVVSGIEEMTMDLDARVFSPHKDVNDKLCALIKVTFISNMQSLLILEVGGLGVVAREEKPGGEVWFYVPAQVKNLFFRCTGYAPLDPIPVKFKEGTVYRITLTHSTTFETVSNAVLRTNYLKIGVNEEGATISIGRTKNYELLSRGFDGDLFAAMLDLGEYFYKIEHPFYETYYGSVVLDSVTPQQNIQLKPAYGYLNITSSPSGAMVYVNNRYVGITPCEIEQRIPKGDIDLRIEQTDHYTDKHTLRIIGDGSHQSIHRTLKPRFATVTLQCSDLEAEIFVDNKMVGKGMWSGRLGSISTHHVETRRIGHHSQTTNISVVDGVDATYTLKAPVPLYGTLDISTSPIGCEVAIDGKVVGTTPYISQLLVGNHEITLSKDGYLRTSFPVEIAHNVTKNVAKSLTKSRLNANVTISCVDPKAEIYVNDSLVGYNRWDGVLEEGKYIIEARKAGCVTEMIEKSIVGAEKQYVNVLAPKEAFGTLTVNSQKGASVYLISKSVIRTSYGIDELQQMCLPVGSYKAYATKDNYRTTPVTSFEIEEGRHTTIDLPLQSLYSPTRRLNRWCFNPSSHSYYSQFFAEVTWDGAYWGGNVGWFFGKDSGGHFGVHGSFASTSDGKSKEFALGPLFRLGVLGSIESHIFAGVGYNTYNQLPKYEVGVRLAYDFLQTKLNLSSISVGAEYVEGEIYPKIGISLLPINIFAQTKDSDLVWHLGLMNANFSNDGASIGFRLAYTPSTLGWYCSIGYCPNYCYEKVDGSVPEYIYVDGVPIFKGFKESKYIKGLTFTTGPVISFYSGSWRYNYRKNIPYNLYLYGGVGAFIDKSSFEIGIGSSLWFADFWIGCTSYGDKYMLNVGTGFCW